MDSEQMNETHVKKRSWVKRLVRITGALALLVVLFIIYANLVATRAGEGHLFDDVTEVPAHPVGLLFGTTDKIGNRDNLYFVHRIDAAVALWKAGKVECLLVSGDNREENYNEPNKMRDALIERGVPKEVIVRDFAGLRTLDSVVRAQEVFRSPSVIFISQEFQNERAAYLAKSKGFAYSGLNAKDVSSNLGLRTRLREVGARVKMWLDVQILDTEPRHLGDWEYLPITGHPLESARSSQSPPDTSDAPQSEFVDEE